MIEKLRTDRAYQVLCLFILFVLCVSALIPNDANMGRSTSLRSRAQKKIDQVVDSFSDMLDAKPTNKPIPPVFDEREGDEDEE